MIPKKIHYCWFGKGEKPQLAKKCIASWKKYCPDYEIIEWNEMNFDVFMNGYTSMCYNEHKWAFLSDYVRLWAVYHSGGIYFDTDVELLHNPDYLLNQKSFFGFETKVLMANGIMKSSVNSGLGFGAEQGCKALKYMLAEYDFLLDGKHGVIGCPELNTIALEKLGLLRNGDLQTFEWGTVFPVEFFNPYDSSIGKLNVTKNTISVHWYMGSCLTTAQKIRSHITKPLHRIFGKDCFSAFKKIMKK